MGSAVATDMCLFCHLGETLKLLRRKHPLERTPSRLWPMSTALFTDHYELTMVEAAMASGTANRRCVFELFPRRLPEGRRYGVVAGTGRVLDAVENFRFTDEDVSFLERTGVVGPHMAEWLPHYRFTGSIHGYAEGDLYFPGSPCSPSRALSPKPACSRPCCSASTTTTQLSPPPHPAWS